MSAGSEYSNIELSYLYLYLKGLQVKQIYDDTVNTLDNACLSYATVNNLIASFETEKFHKRLAWKTHSVSTSENINTVHYQTDELS